MHLIVILEDAVFSNDESAMKLSMKTFKLLEESFIDTEVKEKEPAKDDVNAEEKKSITEDDAAVVEEKLEATVTATKPDSLPHSEK